MSETIVKPKKQKCSNCKKKMGLMKYECKCSNMFCIKCLQPENHNCSYNFKLEGKKKLKNDMIVVSSNKVIKI